MLNPLRGTLQATIDGVRAGKAGAALTPHQLPLLSEGSLPHTLVSAGGDGHTPLDVSPARGTAHAVPSPA